MIKIITRSKPVDWFCINDDIIEANDVFALINQFMETDEVRDYEMGLTDFAELLCRKGYLTKRKNQAYNTVYEMADRKGFETYCMELIDLWMAYDKERK